MTKDVLNFVSKSVLYSAVVIEVNILKHVRIRVGVKKNSFFVVYIYIHCGVKTYKCVCAFQSTVSPAKPSVVRCLLSSWLLHLLLLLWLIFLLLLCLIERMRWGQMATSRPPILQQLLRA